MADYGARSSVNPAYAHNLPFIDGDVVNDAYRSNNKSIDDERTRALNQEKERQGIDITASQAPSKLRQVNAEAGTAETTLAADKAKLPYVGGLAQTNLRNMTAGADLAETRAAEAKAEMPFAGPKAAAGLAQTQAQTRNLDLQPHLKVLDLLDQGREGEAREYNRAAGYNEIPQHIVDDADMRSTMRDAWKRSGEIYGEEAKANRMEYTKQVMADAQARKAAGQRANTPTSLYDVPNAPEPPESTNTDAMKKPVKIGSDKWGRDVNVITVGGAQYVVNVDDHGQVTLAPFDAEKMSAPQPAAAASPLAPAAPTATAAPNPAAIPAATQPSAAPAAGAPQPQQAPQAPGMPAAAPAPAAVRPGQRNESVLEGAPPGTAEMIRAVADYELDPTKIASLRSGERERLIRMVREYDPTYNMLDFPARNRSVLAFAAGAPLGNMVRSFDVGIAHLGTLDEMITALGNRDMKLWNKAANAFQEQFGYTAPGNFDAVRDIVGSEIAKAVVGSQNALGDREEAKTNFDRSKTDGQLHDLVRTYKTMMTGQLRGLKKQYEDGTKRHDFESRLMDETQRELLGSEPIPSAEARVVGRTYQTPKGPAKWMGTGWQLVQ